MPADGTGHIRDGTGICASSGGSFQWWGTFLCRSVKRTLCKERIPGDHFLLWRPHDRVYEGLQWMQADHHRDIWWIYCFFAKWTWGNLLYVKHWRKVQQSFKTSEEFSWDVEDKCYFRAYPQSKWSSVLWPDGILPSADVLWKYRADEAVCGWGLRGNFSIR